MSLRWRIALALGAIAATTTMVVGAIGYRTTRDRLYDEIDQSLIDSIALLDRPGRPGDWLQERGPLSVFEMQVLNADGAVVGSTIVGGFEPNATQVELVGSTRLAGVQNMTLDGEEYRVRTIGLQNGAFQILRPLDETNRVLDSVRARTLLLVVVVTAVGAGVGFLIAGRVTASLRRP